MCSERKLRLLVGPSEFGITCSWRDKAIILAWVAETEAPNVIWMRMVVLKLSWPPIRHVATFTDKY